MGMDQRIVRHKKFDFPITVTNYAELSDLAYEYGEEKELLYWRKNFDLNDEIGYILGEPVENCKTYRLTKEMLEKLVETLTYWYQEEPDYVENDLLDREEFNDHKESIKKDIEDVQRVIDETNFDEYDVVYCADW